MKMLSKAAFGLAADFMEQHARPLERALFAHHFHGEPAAPALDALAAFQNADGGFGNGLEADIRLKDSSVIATTVAFQRFRELQASPDNPAVAAACRFLRDTYDAGRVNWPITPPSIDDAPHAPWWTPGGDLQKSLANPRAEIAGYLHEYAEHFPDHMREVVTQAVRDHALDGPDRMEMHDLLCYLRFWETPGLPGDVKAALEPKLRQVAENVVNRNPATWTDYGLRPLGVVTGPDSPFASSFTDLLPHNLDFVIDQQGPDGTWSPSWTWGGLWPEAWDEAAQDWTGVLTLENLRTLRAFDRIEE
jgi:hypothetical protein